MEQFYKEENAGNSSNATTWYKAMNCYDALLNLCRCFGLRCLYWNHTIYFIQPELYGTAESGTTAVPVNLTTMLYKMDSDKYITNTQNYVGNNNLSRYYQELLTGVGKMKKIAGTTWDN